jgi:lysophospholipase L1-like esterase
MVGSEADGDFEDNQHEGHPGFVVRQMIDEADKTIFNDPPNVVLINCGTNDADPSKNEDVFGTADRMRLVVEHLLDSVEGTTVVLSTLLPHRQAANNANVNIINDGYRAMAAALAGEGKKVVLAEMNNGIFVPEEDYSDDLHPNEQGAAKMAAVWEQAIAEAEAAGLLTAPIENR